MNKKSLRTMLTKHSPELLTGIGIAGMITTTVMAVKATPKALRLLEEEKANREDTEKSESKSKCLSKLESVKAVWKCYIPAAVTGVTSIACLIGVNSVNAKRNAALTTAYTLSQAALSEYTEKVVETVGEKREQAIRDKIAKDRIEKNPVKNCEVIMTGKGETLCYDSISGRYFYSDIEKLKKAENKLNQEIITSMYVALNEFYYMIGLKPTKIGDDIGWNLDEGLVDLCFSSQLTEDDKPCLVVDYQISPKYNYKTFD